jgi:hypothetical protein
MAEIYFTQKSKRDIGIREFINKKGNLRNTLKKEGFKRLFFKHPASEVYSKGTMKAKIESNFMAMEEENLNNRTNYGANTVYRYGKIRLTIYDSNSDELGDISSLVSRIEKALTK